MIAVDTNILIYAHREEFAEHAAARDRLVALAEGASPWGIPVFCVGEFVRVTTHRKVLTPASTLEQSLAFLEALARSPTFRWMLPEGSFVGDLGVALRTGNATGNLAFDAQVAALCHGHGATLLTHDRDFARFGVRTLAL